MAAAKASVLPPAPAQISSTCWRGPAAAISAAICEPSSCTSYQPRPCPISASTLGCRPGPSGAGSRTPTGDSGVGFGGKPRQRLQHLLAVGLEGVDAQVDRGSAGQRRALLGRSRAEGARERRLQPVREVAAHRRRRIGRHRARQMPPARPRSAAPPHTATHRRWRSRRPATARAHAGAAARAIARGLSSSICAASDRRRRSAS